MNRRQHLARTATTASAAVLLASGGVYALTQAYNAATGGQAGPGWLQPPAAAGAANAGMGMGSFQDGQAFDAQFLDQMIVHHQGAIMSTEAMIADSSRPELKKLAQDILTSQRQQIAQMRQWRTRWYPDLEPTFAMPMMSEGAGTAGSMMGDDSMMSGGMMDNSAATERMYLQMMIPHHQVAVDMAAQAQARATHPALKELAETISAEQAAQIDQMRGYLDRGLW